VDELARVVVRRQSDACVATVTGEIDISNADEIRMLLEDRLVEDAALHVIDLTETQYLDSAGIRMLFTVAERLRERGRTLHIVVPDDSAVRRLMLIVELPSRVALHPALSEVLPRRGA
jgi:anti-anti-sigma factor